MLIKVISLLMVISAPVYSQSFPKDFKWCVATAAHQIEGNNTHSDWWAWEQLDGKIAHNEKSGKASNHWDMLEEDTKLISDLGVDTYRFSVSWSKIEPEKGKFNKEAINHYKKEIALLKQNKIEPFVTLHHFVSPHWFTKSGGWENDDSPQVFLNFVKEAYKHFGNDVNYWVTFNEPMVFIGGGHIEGVTPPGKTDFSIKKPLINFLKAHVLAYQYIHSKNPKAKVGLAHHIRFLEPYRKWHPIDQIIARQTDHIFNWSLLEAFETGKLKIWVPFKVSINQAIPGLKGTQDFIGVNFYTRELLKFTLSHKNFVERKYYLDKPRSDLNWEIWPEGFQITLDRVSKMFPGRDILITENGIADKDDKHRKFFIKTHLEVILNSLKKKYPIKGYCHWSLLDNFEWIEGFEPRFGLYHVDYKTFKRTLRPSGEYLKEVIRKNSL
jgi:beta-glucosidase